MLYNTIAWVYSIPAPELSDLIMEVNMTKAKKITAAVLAAASLLSVTACGGGGRSNNNGGDTTAAPTTTAPQTTPETYDTDAAVQEAIANIEVDKTIKPEKKLKWLSWYPIDETSSEVELFKANYGIPEEGDATYGDYANNVFQYINVSYNERYDRLGALVSAGDSPDISPSRLVTSLFLLIRACSSASMVLLIQTLPNGQTQEKLWTSLCGAVRTTALSHRLTPPSSTSTEEA